jgi:CubicO group peptidase (beta-lactamase class C family)
MHLTYFIASLGILFGLSSPAVAAVERMAEDTPRATPAGTTFVAPAGWSVTTRGTVTIVESPEGDSRIALCDVRAAGSDAAEAAAWAAYRPGGVRPAVKSVFPITTKNGWADRHAYAYNQSPNTRRDEGATTMRAGDAWTVVIYDVFQPTGEKRGGQIAVIYGRLYPKGYQPETFAGRKANRLDAARVKELTAFVERARVAMQVPGVALGLVQDGKVVFAGGFGVRELGKPAKVDADTLFLIASTTKAMTTLMLGKLVESGALAWDTPVTEVFPAFKLGDAETTKKVLIKHLICACTGLPRQDMEWALEFASATPASVLALLGTMQPTSKFGEMFQYSNVLAAAAGYVGGYRRYPKLELGAAYDRAMKTEVFGPLAMTATTFDFARALRGNHATPHGKTIDDTTEVATMDFNRAAIPIRPAGGAWSSVRDVLKYVAMETQGGLLPNGRRYVAESVLKDRRAPQVAIGTDATYGMGLSVGTKFGTPVVGHDGALTGFSSRMSWLPEHGVGAVVLTNSNVGWAVQALFTRKLLEVLFDARPEAEADLKVEAEAMTRRIHDDRKTLSFPAAAAEAAKLAPRYRHATLGAIDVIRSGRTPVFDFGEWRSEVATRKNPDGTITFVTTSPGLYGHELVAGSAAGKPTLTVRDAQHEYVFTADGNAPATLDLVRAAPPPAR